MTKIDPTTTAAVIADMAHAMQKCSEELGGLVCKMISENDVYIASDAMSTITNCISNLRLDLLVTRIVREYERKQ